MPVYDLFSKRTKRLKQEEPDIFRYDFLSKRLRGQLVYILDDVIDKLPNGDAFFSAVIDIIYREYGIISERFFRDDNRDAWVKIILNGNDVDMTLDLVDVALKILEEKLPIPVKLAIAELNQRFLEDAVGYRYESGKLIRVDSELMHSEVLKPVLLLLSDIAYKGANEEFLLAHKHYRAGDNEDCLTNCCKAFESTLKVICTKRSWNFDPHKDTAKRLLEICLKNNLIPPYLQSHYSSLLAMLESGIPTIRNRDGGHGKGVVKREIPNYFASYALHLTASTVLFLVNAEKALV
jgi:hypothetical protein